MDENLDEEVGRGLHRGNGGNKSCEENFFGKWIEETELELSEL